MTQVSNWTRENISWFAGLFEGEGCTSINRGTGKSPRMILSITMTDEDVIRKAHNVIGLGNVTGPHGPYRPNEKATWSWRVSRFEECQAIAAALYPFLCSRRQSKILEVLEILKTEKRPRVYGDEKKCGNSHDRDIFSFKNSLGQWICKECLNLKERNRKRRSDKAKRLAHIPKAELKNYCGAGHPKVEEHGKIEKSGQWRCLTCRKISTKERNAKAN